MSPRAATARRRAIMTIEMKGVPPNRRKSPDKGGLRRLSIKHTKRRHGTPGRECPIVENWRCCCSTLPVAVSLGVLIFLVLLPQGDGASLRQRRALNLQLRSEGDPLSHHSSSQSFLSMGVLSREDKEEKEDDGGRGGDNNDDKGEGDSEKEGGSSERDDKKGSGDSKSEKGKEELTEASLCGKDLQLYFKTVCRLSLDSVPAHAKLFVEMVCSMKDKTDENFSTVIKALDDLRAVPVPQTPPQAADPTPIKLHDLISGYATKVETTLSKCERDLKKAESHSRNLGTSAISDDIVFLTSMSGLLRETMENIVEVSRNHETDKTAAAP